VEIVKYPHPTLRYKSKPLRKVDAELKKMIREMFDLMYAHQGVGLAANQVNLPYRFFIINLEGDPTKGEEHVFINPVISRRRGSAENEEGCLSFPNIWAPVRRTEKLHLSAFDLAGKPVELDLSGMFARAVQHEYDHLDGIQFIDRLTPIALGQVQGALDKLIKEYQDQRAAGTMPDDNTIMAELAKLESLRT
jgi:peptide deformylase